MQCSHKRELEHSFLFVGRYGPIYKIVKVIKIIQFVYYAKKNVYLFLYMAKAALKVEWSESGVCFQCTYFLLYLQFSSVQFSGSVMSNCLQSHESQYARPPCPSPTPRVHSNSVHWVGDAFQPSHPLSSPSPLAPNPSQHQNLFQWVNSSHEVAKVLEFQL